MESRFTQIWYSRTGLTQLLRPLSWIFCSVVFVRRWLYRLHLMRSTRLSVPVLVVGNLTVGGTGKTPMVVTLSNMLKQAGYRPGIISRGYGGKARTWPQQVRPDSDPAIVGDEPILIARRTRCPMAVGPDRVVAGEALLKYADCDIIISDDGLQHYALKRDVEIIVVDGVRRFGNGFCLPAGPLREPVRRLERADFVVTNGTALKHEYAMHYEGEVLINLKDKNRTCRLDSFKGKQVHAIAAIGHPQRFFASLRKAGLKVEEHAFVDHHVFTPADLDYGEDAVIIMTEKDAVKCQRFSTEHMWYLPVEAVLNNDFEMQLLNRIEKRYGQKSA